MKTTPTTDFTKKVTQLYQLKQRAGAWTSEISGNILTHEGLSLNFGQWQNMIWKSTSNTLLTSTVITCQLSENHQNEQGMLPCPGCNPNGFESYSDYLRECELHKWMVVKVNIPPFLTWRVIWKLMKDKLIIRMIDLLFLTGSVNII